MTYIESLERKVLDLAMVRLEEWRAEHPGGIIKDGPHQMAPVARAFIEACLELQASRREQSAAVDERKETK